MPTSRSGPVARRTLLGAAVAAVALPGCSVVDRSRTTSPEAAGSPSKASPSPDLDPDVAVAAEALTAVRRLHDAVVSTTRRFPALGAQLDGLAALHEEHERVLVDAVPEEARPQRHPAPLPVPRRRPRAFGRLRVAEGELHDNLGALARRAESGDFARLLAAMGAAVTQRLEEWPE